MTRSRSGRPPTLAILSPSREDAGAERYMRRIACGAVAGGWPVHAAFPPLQATAPLRGELAACAVTCHALGLGGAQPRGLGEALRLTAAEALVTARLLRRVAADTVLVVLPHPDQAPGMVLAAALYPRRTVVNVQLVPAKLSTTKGRRLLYRAARGLGQRWVAVSGENQRRLAGALGWRETAIAVIYNGVDEDCCFSGGAAETRTRVREELRLPRGARLVLSVGRLNYQKGHDLIAESIPSVIADHPDAYWVWAGDGPQRSCLAAQLRRVGVSDRVVMLGARSDVPRLMAASDLLVFPSRYEGAPFALLEALLCELPVLVSDAGPLPEFVRDGVDGCVVPAEDPVALAARTSWALAHPGQMSAMAASGRRRVLAEFSCATMTDDTLAMLWPNRKLEWFLTRSAAALGRRSGSARPRDPR
jgi:glycosyltransferase involved in cell wall biosynthesis